MPVGLIKTGAGSAAVYTVNGGAGNAPDWLARKGSKKGKSRARDEDTDPQGIRLIQDLDFPEASNKVKSTRDGRFLISTGTYKPRTKVWELDDLGLKFERTTDAENVDFQILSDDWTKTLHLQSDRSVEMHNQACAFYRTRIPKAGRALAYHYPSADALVGGLGGQVYRLNLEQGRFLAPFSLSGNQPDESGSVTLTADDAVAGVNALDINPAHQLLAFGTETYNGKGTVEFWDHRVRKRVGLLSLPYSKLASSSSSAAAQLPGLSLLDPLNASLNDAQVSVTALASRDDGLNLAVGTSTGHTLLYDLRSPRPYTIKDQGYGLPIKKIEWPSSGYATSSEDDAGPLVASADEKVVKIWSTSPSAAGKNLVAVTAPVAINDMHIHPNSGLIFLANEQSAMTGYYVPQLGQAPKWCRFLDNMTEEMEDDQQAVVYEDYKFVDRKELQSLNLEHLIGTDTLRPYMHGFFMDLRLYSKAKTLANPFAYAEYRQKLINDKLEKERESRIRTVNKGGAKAKTTTPGGEKITVNKELVERLQSREEKEKEKERRKRKHTEDEEQQGGNVADTAEAAPPQQPSLLTDDRFSTLFTNPDFAIDESSKEFAMLNPSAAAQKKQRVQEPEEEDEGSELEDDGSGADSDSSAEGELITYEAPAPRTKQREIEPIRRKDTPSAAPTMTMEHESGSSKAAASQVQSDSAQGKTFAELSRRHGRKVGRGASTSEGPEDGVMRSTGGGNMEYTFMPSASKSAEAKEEKRAKINAKKAKTAQFGYGLEKGGGPQEEEAKLEGEEGSGRQRRRKVGRSASNSALRKMASGSRPMQRK